MKNEIKFNKIIKSKKTLSNGVDEISQTTKSKCFRFSILRLTTFLGEKIKKSEWAFDQWSLYDECSKKEDKEIYSSTKLSDCKKYANEKVKKENDERMRRYSIEMSEIYRNEEIRDFKKEIEYLKDKIFHLENLLGEAAESRDQLENKLKE